MSSCCGDIGVTAQSSVHLAAILSTGFMISVGHCVGMCGPIAALTGQTPGGRRASSLTLYHLGRLTSYMALGVAAGGLGALVTPDALRPAQGALSLTTGLLSLVIALALLGRIPLLNASPLRPGSKLSCKAASLLRETAPGKRFLLGMGNGLLPCGPVYAVVVLAAGTGSPWMGGAVLLAFGLGTVPILTAIGLGSSWMAPKFRANLYSVGKWALVLVGLQLTARGMASLGWIDHLAWRGFVVF